MRFHWLIYKSPNKINIYLCQRQIFKQKKKAVNKKRKYVKRYFIKKLNKIVSKFCKIQ